ncbi:signal peptidase I [Paucilactobacillus vaccinostercus DSM 20634]|jgi:signal peptidase I|uniref:Signal peptidase I n=1 Tax=Paucilactobacillus vaccinostercus DSM 20634 TaxID=1423813 RepID=A0A0R2A2U9_9LACO|nr:signal peptidase I [Paucilactobacillus vaccinostercus]KRM61710.1 signal peptidase I [Paucilactobacillus vaccinostercus DSM 20634]RRG11083.1 MAG: signal peptidase I [Lactobacillus sp.]
MKALKEILSWIVPIAIGLLAALLIKNYVFQLVRVDGPSMQPNLENNERVLVSKRSTIHRGSVIVFEAQGVDPQVTTSTDYVKRVIALPGDTVSSKNGVIYVNGKKTDQSYIGTSERTTGTGNWNLQSISVENQWQKNQGATKVPKGEYFVLGDHRSVSNDGRYWGFVPKNKILGVVKVPFWNRDATKKANINTFWKSYFDN